MMLHMKNILVVAVLLLSACSSSFEEPVQESSKRPTPLAFGQYVTPDPAQNPIEPPERFVGFHVGTDYEVTAEELDAEVPVYAICTGTGAFSGFAKGYGGLFVEECTIFGEPAVVIYGHLRLDGLPKVHESVQVGQQIGVLAPANSKDSDGNRKHLHLGIHKGPALDIRGYVQYESEINQFLDPQLVVPLVLPEVMGRSLTPYWKE